MQCQDTDVFEASIMLPQTLQEHQAIVLWPILCALNGWCCLRNHTDCIAVQDASPPNIPPRSVSTSQNAGTGFADPGFC